MKIFNQVNLFWKIFIGVILVAAIATVAILSIRFLSSPEDAWLCKNGQWVKHGSPSASEPTTGCGSSQNPVPTDEVIVTRPEANQTINSPLTVEGQARGNWFFEASFPIELVDDQGKILGQSFVQAQSDPSHEGGVNWMTTDFVPFKGELNYQVATTTTGKLVLKNDNPSGLAENDKKIEIPVLISPSQVMTVKVFFGKYGTDSSMLACEKVYPVERIVAKTDAIGRAALEQLLAGPTEQEKAQGFYTSINSGVKINKLTITDGVAKVDFNETMEEGMGGSCRVSAIRAQTTQTLKQFSTVKDVIISVNGRVEDVLQP
ncbi:MAG: GerMN domain-containing protein [Patescibacteria group bacterium]|jgi:hypothetical protein